MLKLTPEQQRTHDAYMQKPFLAIKEIAHRLGKAHDTIKKHLSASFKRGAPRRIGQCNSMGYTDKQRLDFMLSQGYLRLSENSPGPMYLKPSLRTREQVDEWMNAEREEKASHGITNIK